MENNASSNDACACHGASAPRTAGALFCSSAACAALGALVGFAVWALLSLAYLLISLIWDNLSNALGAPLVFPVVICTLGGILAGAWNARFQCAPQSLVKTLDEVKRTGGYTGGPLGPSCVSFLIPIAFGGSVGPEAGLTGFIARGCTWIGRSMRAVAARVSGAQEAPFARWQKCIVYPCGIAGGIAGAWAVTALGGGMEFPRFDAFAWSFEAAVIAVPLVAVGYALALINRGATLAARRLSRKFKAHPIAAPALCGLAMGAVAVAFPLILFPGSQQAVELMGTWQSMPAWILIVTGIIKAAFIALCIGLGWNGGPYFPLMFSSISMGYGIAAATGADPLLCCAVVTASLVAAFSRKPIVTIVLMLLCFPVQDLPWIAAAAFIGVHLPMPGAKENAQERDKKNAPEQGKQSA